MHSSHTKFILYFGSNIHSLVIGWKSFKWLYVFSTISECWHVWHSMVYHLENYVTFYDDTFQPVHHAGNDVTAILVMKKINSPKIRVNSAAIRKLSACHGQTPAISRLYYVFQFPIPIAPVEIIVWFFKTFSLTVKTWIHWILIRKCKHKTTREVWEDKR